MKKTDKVIVMQTKRNEKEKNPYITENVYVDKDSVINLLSMKKTLAKIMVHIYENIDHYCFEGMISLNPTEIQINMDVTMRTSYNMINEMIDNDVIRKTKKLGLYYCNPKYFNFHEKENQTS